MGTFLLVTALLTAPAFFPQEARQARDLTARIEAVREKAGLPSLCAALVTVDGLEGIWVTGKRRADGEELAEAEDQWHLGSCTKSMTATLIALLVARGDLSWDTPLGEALPDLVYDMDTDYLELTLVELLCHRAGLAANPSALMDSPRDAEDLIARRAELTRMALTTPAVHPPRGAFLYSNSGFMVAGHIAEVATGKPWETLMRELLFEPLGMKSAGFGPPGSAQVCDQPRGHTPNGMSLAPGPQADNPPVIGPAGTVHASLGDWAKYIQLHLKGVRGDVKVGEITLTQDDFALLHTPYEGPGMPYGFGWLVDKRPWGGGDGTVLWHNGSNGMWFSLTWLGLGNGVAALVTTNLFSPAATTAADQAVQLVIEEYQARKEPVEER